MAVKPGRSPPMPPAKKLDPGSPLAIWGAMLRHYRERAELTQERLGELLHYSVAQVSSLETARRDPTKEAAARADQVLRTGGSLTELLTRLKTVTAREVYPDWFRPWVDEEGRATVLRKFQLALVDGLLQTEAYARALLGGDE